MRPKRHQQRIEQHFKMHCDFYGDADFAYTGAQLLQFIDSVSQLTAVCDRNLRQQ